MPNLAEIDLTNISYVISCEEIGPVFFMPSI